MIYKHGNTTCKYIFTHNFQKTKKLEHFKNISKTHRFFPKAINQFFSISDLDFALMYCTNDPEHIFSQLRRSSSRGDLAKLRNPFLH